MIVFCLYGQNDIFRESKYEQVTQWDWRKVGRFLQGTWPKPLGDRLDFTTGVTGDIPEWVTRNTGELYEPLAVARFRNQDGVRSSGRGELFLGDEDEE